MLRCFLYDVLMLCTEGLDRFRGLPSYARFGRSDRTQKRHGTSGWDWDQWLVSVEDVEEEERLVAEAKETAKAWVDSLVGDVDMAPK